MILKKKCPKSIEVENILPFRIAVQNRFDALWNHDCNIEEKSNNLAEIIKEAAEMTNNTDKSRKNSTYSETTIELMKARRNMKIKNKEDENKKSELNKLINKRTRKEKREKERKREDGVNEMKKRKER